MIDHEDDTSENPNIHFLFSLQFFLGYVSQKKRVKHVFNKNYLIFFVFLYEKINLWYDNSFLPAINNFCSQYIFFARNKIMFAGDNDNLLYDL